MEAKEKAKELVDKFYLQVDEMVNPKAASHQAKQCALICVDEILRDYKNSTEALPSYAHVFIGGIVFWQEVKTEINKL